MDIITVENETIGVCEEKKSVFYAHLFPVSSKGEFERRAEEIIAGHKAKHVLKTYRISPALEYASEDREPIRSAHIILSILQQIQLFEVGVIIVRYYGGILLGASNLEKAYLKAFTEAFNKARRVRYQEMPIYRLRISVKDYSRLSKLYPELMSENCRFDGPEVETEIFGIDAVRKLETIGIKPGIEVNRRRVKLLLGDSNHC